MGHQALPEGPRHPENLGDLPEFVDLAVDPKLLAIATDHLGELPVVFGLFLWHDDTQMSEPMARQVHRIDYGETRSSSVFLNVSDVVGDAGPLTVIPADVAARACRALKYRYGSHIPDEEMPSFASAAEIELMGPPGTLSLIDTCKCFQFGGGIRGRNRSVVVLRYLTCANFLQNPFKSTAGQRGYRYAPFARPDHLDVQRAVLDPDAY